MNKQLGVVCINVEFDTGCIPITLLKVWCTKRTAEDQGLGLVEPQTAVHAIQRGLT